MKKLLSVIVPTYNMEKLLRDNLLSLVIDQSLLDFLEVVIVNDGSKDGSLEIARSFAITYPRTFLIIDKPNGNYGSCINAALKVISGKYVRIMDADDLLLTKELESFVKFLQDTDADLIFSDYIKYYGEGDIETISFDLPVKRVLEARDYYTTDAFESIQMPSLTYRSDIFRKVDYHQTEGISYTDMEWCFAPISQVRTFVYFDRPVYRYLLSREGQTMDINVQKRRFSHVLMSLTSMLNAKLVLHADGDADAYLEGQILRHLLYVYRFYLVEHKDIDRTDLRKFDKVLLEKCPEAYEKSGKFEYRPKISFLYVNEWRKGKNEFIPKSVLIKEKILDFLGRQHVKMMK